MNIALADAALRGAIVAWLLLLLLRLPRGATDHGPAAAAAPAAPAVRSTPAAPAVRSTPAVPAVRSTPAVPAVAAARALCAGLVVQVVASVPWVEQHLDCAWQAPLVAISVGNAVLFWLFVASLFDDDFRWRAVHVLAWAGAAVVGALQCLAMGGEPALAGAAPVLRGLLRLVPAVCAVAAAWAALRHWRADLVEPRRHLRVVVLVGGGAYTLLQLAARLGSARGMLSPEAALLDMSGLALLIGTVAALTLRMDAPWWGGPLAIVSPPARPDARAATAEAAGAGQPPAASTPIGAPPAAPSDAAGHAASTEAPDPRLAAALHTAMTTDRLYRGEDLTVASLAATLGVPEYRLRRHINGQLGFRNFNAFVNSFRLADARRWLADPAMRETPILTLALDAGFQSIGPFNRAFKADTGLTPTEFRQRELDGP